MRKSPKAACTRLETQTLGMDGRGKTLAHLLHRWVPWPDSPCQAAGPQEKAMGYELMIAQWGICFFKTGSLCVDPALPELAL